METTQKVQKIENGCVIDHITPGRGLVLASILDLTAENGGTILVATNLPSATCGRKDLIKMEDRVLTPDEEDKVALVSPEATVAMIRDYAVAEKRRLAPPDAVEGLIRCPNPRCITALEPHHRFLVESKDPVVVRCHFCERTLAGEEIGGNIVVG